MADSSTNDTSFYGYHAKRLGKYPTNDEGDQSPFCELTACIIAEFGDILPEPLTIESNIERNENYCDVYVVTFNNESKNGLFVNQVEGVWLLSGGEHPWAAVQRLDLIFNINAGKMTIESLK